MKAERMTVDEIEDEIAVLNSIRSDDEDADENELAEFEYSITRDWRDEDDESLIIVGENVCPVCHDQESASAVALCDKCRGKVIELRAMGISDRTICMGQVPLMKVLEKIPA